MSARKSRRSQPQTPLRRSLRQQGRKDLPFSYQRPTTSMDLDVASPRFLFKKVLQTRPIISPFVPAKPRCSQPVDSVLHLPLGHSPCGNLKTSSPDSPNKENFDSAPRRPVSKRISLFARGVDNSVAHSALENTSLTKSLQVSFKTPAPLEPAEKKGLTRRPKNYRSLNVTDFQGGIDENLQHDKESQSDLLDSLTTLVNDTEMLSVATKLFSQPQLSGQDGEEASIVPSQADFQERSPTPENSSKMHLDTANEISQSTRVETPCVSRRNTKELKNPPATQMVDKAETDPESEEMTDTETDFENIDPTGKTPAFVYARAFDCIPLLATPHALKVDASRLSPKQHNVKRAPMPSRKARRTKDGPELPSSLIKNLFSHYAQVPVSKDAFKVVERSVSVYFKHLSNDLKAFANHAGRKTAEPADMELLMRRQGLITEKTPLNVLIEQHMPLEYRELLLPIATSGNKVVPPKLK